MFEHCHIFTQMSIRVIGVWISSCNCGHLCRSSFLLGGRISVIYKGASPTKPIPWISSFSLISKMMDDTPSQRHTTQNISTAPTREGDHVREPSLLSRIDEDDLDHNFASHQFSSVSLGLGRSTSAVEKSFKPEEYIYVSLFPPPPFPSRSSKWWLSPLLQVDFEEGDQRNPINFSRRKKWAITAIACFGTYLACKPRVFFFFNGQPKNADKITNSGGCSCLWFGIQINDTGSTLHRVPSDHWLECIYVWVRCRPPRNGIFQWRVWPSTFIHRVWNRILPHVCNDCIVRWISITLWIIRLTFTFYPGQKISRRSLLHAFYKVRLGLQPLLWLEEPLLIYGWLRSMSFNHKFTYHVKPFW